MSFTSQHILELTIATGKPRSALAETETAHFHGRKGTRVVHMLSAELEMCTYQSVIQINYLFDMALNNFQISGQHPEKVNLKPPVMGFEVLRVRTTLERFVSIATFWGFISNLPVYLNTDLINLNHIDVAFCCDCCAIQGNNFYFLEAQISAEHVSN